MISATPEVNMIVSSVFVSWVVFVSFEISGVLAGDEKEGAEIPSTTFTSTELLLSVPQEFVMGPRVNFPVFFGTSVKISCDSEIIASFIMTDWKDVVVPFVSNESRPGILISERFIEFSFFDFILSVSSKEDPTATSGLFTSRVICFWFSSAKVCGTRRKRRPQKAPNFRYIFS